MAGLIRPRMYPIRDIGSNKQDSGIIFNPKRFPDHGGFTSADKYPKGDRGLMDVTPPTSIKSAEVSRRSSDD